MTSFPNTLVGTRPQTADIEAGMAVTVRPEIAQPRVAKDRLKPETLMLTLLAIWMVLSGLILGITALSY